MVYEIIRDCPVTGARVLADNVIKFTSRWASHGYPSELRMVTYYSPEKNHTFKFITNHMDIEAATLALLYIYRWEIEQFFKWIKQHLRITNFFGYSENAVIIQIYTAYITYCLLALTANEVKFKGSLYDFSNLISTCVTEKEWLYAIIDRYNGINDVGLCTQQPSLSGTV